MSGRAREQPHEPVRRVVLVHGSRLGSSQWAPQRPLLEPDLEVVAVDLPGHGARAGERFTLDRAVAVVQAAVTADPAPTVLVGHSLGGYVALAHASRHAADLAGLVLAGCTATPTGAGAAAYRLVAAVTQRLGPERLGPRYDRVLRRAYPPEVIEPVLAGGWFFDPTPDAWREVMAHCRPGMLTDVGCPVMFVHGRWDQFRLGVRAFRRVSPQAEEVVIPGASHFVNLDQPRWFAEAVGAFASRC